MKIEQIDRAALKEIDNALLPAVKMAAEELGLEVEIKGGSYDPTVGTASRKVEFSLGGAAEREFARYAPIFGLKAEDYGKEFTSRGTTYRLVELSTRRPKFPAVGERTKDGKLFKFTEQVLKQVRDLPEGD